ATAAPRAAPPSGASTMAMVGTSTTVAPRCARVATNRDACSAARVTTTLRPSSGRSAEEVTAQVEPALCREAQRLEVDPLVVAGDPGRELVVGDGWRQESEAVRDDARVSEETGVRSAGRDARQQRGAGCGGRHEAFEGGPQRRCHRALRA